MGRVCFVCQSIHKDEYDQLKLSGKSIRGIYLYSQSKYNENLKYHHFQKHFMQHLGTIEHPKFDRKSREAYFKIQIEAMQRILSDILNIISQD